MGPAESEFDPTIYTVEFVTAEVEEPLSAILEKVETALRHTPNVVLIIPRESRAFHTTHDFLALGKLHSGREVQVAVASPDPMITSLARVLGFHTGPMPEDHPYMEHAASGGTPPSDGVEQPTAPLPLGINREVPEWVLSQSAPSYPSSSLTTSSWLNSSGDPASMHDGAARAGQAGIPHMSQPLSRSGVPRPRTRPRQTGQLQPAIITDPSLPSITGDRFNPAVPLVSTTQSGRIKARRIDDEAAAYVNLGQKESVRRWRRSAVRKTLVGALLLLVFGLAGAGAYAYTYLPEGTVQVTPLTQNITGLVVQIPVLVSPEAAGEEPAQGNSDDPNSVLNARTVAAKGITATITEEGMAPTTGVRQVPRGRAQGTLTFTNRTSYPVTIPKGTLFKAANGATVQVSKGGVVPATIFGPGATVASATLDIEATVEGPEGNIEANQIQGVYDGRLNYINTAAVQGGSLETIKVATQGDIDNLTADLTAKVQDPSRAMGLIVGQVAGSRQLITQTLQVDPPAVQQSLEAGQDGESVHVVVSTQARAYAFDKAEMSTAVDRAVQAWVPRTYASIFGPVLDPAGTRYETPAVGLIDKEHGRIVYTTSVSARVSFNLTPTFKNRILALVTGKTIAQARSLVTQQYGEYVNTPTIQARVLGFELDRLPGDPDRITVTEGAGGSYMRAPGPELTSPHVEDQR